jgi:hypothetical protein
MAIHHDSLEEVKWKKKYERLLLRFDDISKLSMYRRLDIVWKNTQKL